jgi:hypothetical protein
MSCPTCIAKTSPLNLLGKGPGIRRAFSALKSQLSFSKKAAGKSGKSALKNWKV